MYTDIAPDEDADDHRDLIHVYPTFGREHVLDGLTCWCRPERDAECPDVVVHVQEH